MISYWNIVLRHKENNHCCLNFENCVHSFTTSFPSSKALKRICKGKGVDIVKMTKVEKGLIIPSMW